MPKYTPEAREFVDMVNAVGWSQSEAGRQLMLTPSFINQIFAGTAQPSRAILQLLKLTIASRRPELLRSESKAEGDAFVLREEWQRPDWEQQLIVQLRALPEGEREKVLDIAKRVMDLVPKRGRTKSDKSDVQAA